jgi:hypothetical protein
MDRLVYRAVVPEPPESQRPGPALGRWVLTMRAKLQVMPPLPLAYHLVRKGIKTYFAKENSE